MGKKKKELPERVRGLYSAIPHDVQDSVAFLGASHPAKALIYELLRQLNGCNNGHLQLTMAWLSKRGWTSCDVVQRAKNELVERGLSVETRKGGLNSGPSQFAVTWLSISNFAKLDILRADYRPGAWANMNKLPRKIAATNPPRGTGCTADRSCTIPQDGVGATLSAPGNGSKTAHFAATAVPGSGSNVVTATPLPGQAAE